MVEPEEECVSAFAAYSGLSGTVTLSRSQKRKARKHKVSEIHDVTIKEVRKSQVRQVKKTKGRQAEIENVSVKKTPVKRKSNEKKEVNSKKKRLELKEIVQNKPNKKSVDSIHVTKGEKRPESAKKLIVSEKPKWRVCDAGTLESVNKASIQENTDFSVKKIDKSTDSVGQVSKGSKVKKPVSKAGGMKQKAIKKYKRKSKGIDNTEKSEEDVSEVGVGGICGVEFGDIHALDEEEHDELAKQVSLQIDMAAGSTHSGKKLLSYILAPHTPETFFSDYWERRPLLVKRGQKNYYSKYLASAEIDTMLKEHRVMFTKHLDVTSYENGLRETHNQEGRAHAHVVWDYYRNGCSIRLLNPQAFLPKVKTLLCRLQEYFGCFVGANVYLTPAGTQGFAPHYDDIEAFVLQLEGMKRWKVYPPRSGEELPRWSSKNLKEEEVGEPLMEVTLEPGDLLYFPRGFIHQASTPASTHSLHLTVSAYQRTAWVDLIDKVLPEALSAASKERVDLRRGLPVGYLGRAGRGYLRPTGRGGLLAQLTKLTRLVEKHLGAGLDAAVDKMALNFLHEALPPALTSDEEERTVYCGSKMTDGRVEGSFAISSNSSVRWIRKHCCRLVEEYVEGEEGLVKEARLYHSVDNPLLYRTEEPQYLVVDPSMVPAVLHLLTAYPSFTLVSTLPNLQPQQQVMLVGDLWDRGLLMTKSPVQLEQQH